jgi:hypothetical protein
MVKLQMNVFREERIAKIQKLGRELLLQQMQDIGLKKTEERLV